MLINTFSNESAQQLSADPLNLAVIAFDCPITREIEYCIPSGLGSTDASDFAHELWKIKGEPVVSGVSGHCRWSESGDFLFTSISLDDAQCKDLAAATQATYTELLAFIKQSGHTELLRFWNYIPSINQGQGDKENYKIFCHGRLNAFAAAGIGSEEFPAASALGHITSGMSIYAISSVHKGQHHANTRQQNAYQYPRQYGISSPSFARATSLEQPDARLLFISGTASIVGHETLHEGDLAGQLKTTQDNIVHLLDKTAFAIESVQTMKVYLRDRSYLEDTRKFLDKDFPDAQKIFTIADICRSDLMIEVECFCCATTGG